MPRVFIYTGHLGMVTLLQNRYINSTGAFVALFYVKPDSLPLTQRAKPVTLNRAVMDEDISPFIVFNETEPLFLVKPLHFTFCQSPTLLSHVFPRWVVILPKTKKPLPNMI